MSAGESITTGDPITVPGGGPDLTPRPGSDGGVLVGRDRALGHIVLNRPQAINALTLDMVTAVTEQLREWAGDDRVAAVVLRGVGDRGLCAGGDIRALHGSISAGDETARRFWQAEYAMNAAIADYRKPTVSIMDGIVMGGGLGFAGYASLRVATERLRAAMPETMIGFFPDVGSLFLLSRAPGQLGTHLALTGDIVGSGDAIAAGLADLEFTDVEITDLLEHLAAGGSLRVGAGRVPPGRIAGRSWLTECYGGSDAAAIVARLAAHDDPDARAAAEAITARSPLSVAVTLAALRRAESMTLLEVLDADAVIAGHFADSPDFVEGVRARIIDKDRTPRWQHASLAEVTADQVQAFFRAPARV